MCKKAFAILDEIHTRSTFYICNISPSLRTKPLKLELAFQYYERSNPASALIAYNSFFLKVSNLE